MTVRTHVADALDRIGDEQELVEEKRAAFRTFQQRVESLPTSGLDVRSRSSPVTDGGMVATASATGRDRGQSSCEQVCAAFAETVVPCCRVADDESDAVLLTLREELGEEVALTLAPTTDGQFTAQVKQAVLSAVRSRREELGTFATALDAERESVRNAAETVERVVDWLVTADETPLSTLAFDTLQQRHDTLTEHRERCEAALDDRQEMLAATTSQNGSVGVSHRSVVRSLYDEFPITYPVLGTLLRLVQCCTASQRTVRAHLVRRA